MEKYDRADAITMVKASPQAEIEMTEGWGGDTVRTVSGLRLSTLIAILVVASTVSADDCLSLEEAQTRADALGEQGREVYVESHQCPDLAYAVRVDDLEGGREQRAAILQFERAGIEAEPEGNNALLAGQFVAERDAEDRLLNILALGYRSISILHTERSVERYRVVAADDSQGEADEGPDEFIFGDSEARDEPSDDDGGSDARWEDWALRLDDLRLHTGYLPRSRQAVETYHDGTVSASLRWLPGGSWEARAGARLDGQAQTASDSDEADVGTASATPDYTENWLRYRADWGRLTVGTQTVPWGTMDLLPPSDRLSTLDLTRGPLEAIDDSRRATLSLRMETYGTINLDVIVAPMFRPAELPRAGTLWHPVDQRRGRLLGVPDDPLVRELVRSGSFSHEPRSGDEDVVGGVRMTRAGRAIDLGFTLQSARQSAPYYALTDDAREALLANGPAGAVAAPGDTFEARHPRSFIVGADMALDAAAVTWRLEGVWSSDQPATREEDLDFVTRRGLDWAAGAEFFPGDADLRVSLQLTGQHLLDADDVLDPTDTVQWGGEIEQPWARERWHTRLRFQFGLDRTDVYVNPELAWSVTDANEVSLTGHYFRGSDDTLGGFFEDHHIVMLGWRLSL